MSSHPHPQEHARNRIPLPPPPGHAQPPQPSSPRSSTPIDSSQGDSGSGEESHQAGQSTSDILTDDALLAIFYSCVNDSDTRTSVWHTLIHVSRRWRHIVFASPRRLGVRVKYSGKKSLSQMVEVWPRLPIAIEADMAWDSSGGSSSRCDNIIAILNSEHGRVCEIKLDFTPNLYWERIAAAMQKPFPELTHLDLGADDYLEPVLPDSLFGGSAPGLRAISLPWSQFRAMQNLLLSANGLVTLHLEGISESTYVPLEMLVTCLSAMPRLEQLFLEWQSLRPPPSPNPLATPRSVLPALTLLHFEGVSEYLEDLVAQIDAPLLQRLHAHFFIHVFGSPIFDVPQLHRFVSRTEKLKKLHHATVYISRNHIHITLAQQTPDSEIRFAGAEFLILIESTLGPHRPVSSLAPVCRSSLPPFSTLEWLVIEDDSVPDLPLPDLDDIDWLDLLFPFVAVKNLYLSEEIALLVGLALQELAEGRAAEVLPALQNIFIKSLESAGPAQEAIRGFVDARQGSGHAVAVHHQTDKSRVEVSSR